MILNNVNFYITHKKLTVVFALVIIISLMSIFLFPVSANNTTIGNGIINGAVNQKITPVDFTITLPLDNSFKVNMVAGDDVTAWFVNLPAGLSANVKSTVAVGNQIITVTISGIPTDISILNIIEVTIPGICLTSGTNVVVTPNPNAKYNITSEYIKVAPLPSATPINAYINLTTESMELPDPDEFIVVAFSVDGGKTWKKAALPTTSGKFNKLLDKGMTLYLANALDENGNPTQTNPPTVGAKPYIKFPKVYPRPVANPEKLVVVYYDETSIRLLPKNRNNNFTKLKYDYEYAETVDKKDIKSNWEDYDETFGLPIPTDHNVTYFVRSKVMSGSDGFTPAGKPFTITIKAYGAKPNFTVDYKNEIIKMKKGYEYSINGGSWVKVDSGNLIMPGNGLNVGNYIITAGNGIVAIKKSYTDNTPESIVQVIRLAPRTPITNVKFNCVSGKIVENTQKYEAYYKDKWVSLSSIKESGSYQVRIKPTTGSGTEQGFAYSDEATLAVVYGAYYINPKTGKESNGILSAEIIATP